jgi:hypothetical protein
MMLWDRGQALIQKELEAEVICAYQKSATLDVRPPVANGEDQPNQFPFIRRQRLMPRREGATEECHGVLVLEENGPEAVRRGVALNHKGLSKVGQGQHWRRRDGRLEGGEGRARCLKPGEAILLQQSRQGGGGCTKILDELAVVARKPKETTDRTCLAGLWPVSDGLDLLRVHGHPFC